MNRLILLLLFLTPSLAVVACSCTSSYGPLDALICHFDTTGGKVLEIVLLEKGERNSGRFRVEKVHIGTTDQ